MRINGIQLEFKKRLTEASGYFMKLVLIGYDGSIVRWIENLLKDGKE